MSRSGLNSGISTPFPSAVFSSVADEDSLNATPASSASPVLSASAQDFNRVSKDVAVIGYACRVAGDNDNPAKLWEFLMQKGEASGEIPETRWEPYRTRQQGNDEVLSKTTSKGYFCEKLEDFDAPFFGISPREAEQMDPQQRLALEVAWEALEDAGIAPQNLAGSDTAVFMGVNSDDYAKLLLEDLPNIEAWMGIGTAYCGVANRISYHLDLMGPSTAVDGACASSLVAIHHARQALLSDETSLALAGGVNALIGPGLTRVLDQAKAISTDGRCRSFDDAAAGYGRGEGAGIVILKRLDDAIADEDNILAVLKGSAVGADGKTNGIMAPNQRAQELVARKALKEAGVSPKDVSYIEAHATSTPLGDPTETAAMANVYGSGARTSNPCFIGSIKPNIGHLEAGAGVMGLIKATMVLQKKIVPPQANLKTPNSKINFKESLLQVVTEPTPCRAESQPMKVAVASYGYGGTVSHAILEDAPGYQFSSRRLISKLSPAASSLLVLSATHQHRLKASAARLGSWLRQNPKVDLSSVAYTLSTKRGHHKHRAALVADNVEEASELLEAVAEGKSKASIFKGRALSDDESKGVVWIFSGHGAQWRGMGKTLVGSEPSFAKVVQDLEPIVLKEMGFSVTEALGSDEDFPGDIAQILTYVMQVGIASILKAAGVSPKACIGHSLGEIAASVVAGALTVEEGAFVCCVRARLFRRVAGAGGMILVNIPAHQAAQEIASRLENDITVAIESSPSSCVLSGNLAAIKEVELKLKEKGVQVRTVKTDIAFHSHLMLPLVVPLREQLAGSLKPQEPSVPLYSTSLSDPRRKASRDIEYWVDNMVKPVLLTSAVIAASEDGYKSFLEVSSHPIVTHSVNETLMNADITADVIPTLIRNQDNMKSLLFAMGKLHTLGNSVDFKKITGGSWIHEVPGTVWEHQPYWRKVSTPTPSSITLHDPNEHVILGQRAPIVGTDQVIWQTHINSRTKPFPGNHPLHGAEIVPAAVLLNSFLKAVPDHALQNVSLRVPVGVDPPRDIQVHSENNHLRISSRLSLEAASSSEDSSWLVNTTTQICEINSEAQLDEVSIDEMRQRVSKPLSDSFSIDYLANVGVSEMGFPWKVLEHFEAKDEMLAKVNADPTTDVSRHFGGSSWASILDAATSVSSTLFYQEPLLRMPTAIDRVALLSAEVPRTCYIHVTKAIGDFAADVRIYNEDGHPLINIERLAFAGIEGNATSKNVDDAPVYKLAWPPAQLSEDPLPVREITFIPGGSKLVSQYQSQLATRQIKTRVCSDLQSIDGTNANSLVVFVAESASDPADIYTSSARNCKMLLDLVKHAVGSSWKTKIFAITENAANGTSIGTLSQSALVGLARIIHSEESEVFGGLIDVEDEFFPLQAIKYVHGVDVIRIQDSVARNARLRPFPQDVQRAKSTTLTLKPNGTYLITGGLGALGLEIASWLVERGAKRVVLVSRRRLPPRRTWNTHQDDAVIHQLLQIENRGASVYPVSVDMVQADAALQLQSRLDDLALPPVLGVIHAAGTLANQMVLETTSDAFDSVIAPKIVGAMALDSLFPPKTLDFMVLFSSCGQLLGFTGQAAYASGNAFLDALATRRRDQGDNTTSMLWTSWRGLGMAASTKYIDAELAARGIADVTKESAFRTWSQIANRNVDHAVILRALPLDSSGIIPHPILSDIVQRPAPSASTSTNAPSDSTAEPTSGPELETFLLNKVTGCVASTLGLDAATVDPHTALSELGMDSVMTVELRGQLQRAIGVKVGPTLVWTCPTVALLVKHFVSVKTN